MNYSEMKRKVNELQLEDLAHGITVRELENPQRFEAAGLGIIHDVSVYHGPNIEMYHIYSGSWDSRNKKIVKTIVESSTVDDPYGEYYKMLTNIVDALRKQNLSGKV